jgi:hypothetical protein
MANISLNWYEIAGEAMNLDHKAEYLSYDTGYTPGHKWGMDDGAWNVMMDLYQTANAEGLISNIAPPCHWLTVCEVMMDNADVPSNTIIVSECLELREPFPRMAATFSWAIAHHELYIRCNADVQMEILNICAENSRTATMCKYLFGNTLPAGVQTTVDANYIPGFLFSFPLEGYAEASQQRDWTALYG